MVRIFQIRSYDSLINIVLTFEFGQDITILKRTIFHKVDIIEIEPTLV